MALTGRDAAMLTPKRGENRADQAVCRDANYRILLSSTNRHPSRCDYITRGNVQSWINSHCSSICHLQARAAETVQWTRAPFPQTFLQETCSRTQIGEGRREEGCIVEQRLGRRAWGICTHVLALLRAPWAPVCSSVM